MSKMFHTTIESPIGPLFLAGEERGLRYVSFAASRRAQKPRRDWVADRKPFIETIRQLRQYFAGKLKEFDLPLLLEGTEFQVLVWKNLRKIPYGETLSYGELARRIGKADAVRAVGAANGANPIPIIVPCHRVIGSNGDLIGFGGGLPIKKKLLALEGRQLSLL